MKRGEHAPALACATCGRGVQQAEAQVSRRALGQVLCWQCRDRGPHPDPAREALLEARPVGFGLWEVLTPTGEFIAGGLSESQARSNARRALAR